MIKQKYGVVYTPDSFAQFVAELLKRTTEKCNQQVNTVLDPASGECALLGAAREKYGTDCAYIGIDVDREAVNATKDSFTIFHNDTILPQNVKRKAFEYWKEKLPEIDAIIANPPWSSQKIYDRSELIAAGYTLASGQYDSYVLFLELAVNLLRDNGVLAFIIPDSLFDSQNEKLRKLLVHAFKVHCSTICISKSLLDQRRFINMALSVNENRVLILGKFPLKQLQFLMMSYKHDETPNVELQFIENCFNDITAGNDQLYRRILQIILAGCFGSLFFRSNRSFASSGY